MLIIFRVSGKRTFPTLKSGDLARPHSEIILDQDFKAEHYRTFVYILSTLFIHSIVSSTIVTSNKGWKHVNNNYDYRTIPGETRKSLNENIKDSLHLREKENVTGALDRLTGPLQRIDAVREETMDLLTEKAMLEKVRAWSKSRKDINSYL